MNDRNSSITGRYKSHSRPVSKTLAERVGRKMVSLASAPTSGSSYLLGFFGQTYVFQMLKNRVREGYHAFFTMWSKSPYFGRVAIPQSL